MTQLQSARMGIVTEAMKIVAADEGIEAERVRAAIATGEALIPLNINHINAKAVGVGRLFKTKINANLGRSVTHSGKGGLLFCFSCTATVGVNHRQDGEICNRRCYGGKKKSADEERSYQVPRKLHQRCPVLMRKHIVHRLGDGIPRKSLADETASNPALRRINEND